MRIVVLCGGLSPERNVSLSSGAMVCNALIEKGHQAVLVDLLYGVKTLPVPAERFFEDAHSLPAYRVEQDAPDIEALRRERGNRAIGDNVVPLCQAADMVYMALHGQDGENGKLQAFFDLYNIRYTGSGYMGAAVSMDKWVSKQLLSACGVNVPEGMLLKKGQALPEDVPYPCIVKPLCGGSSIGISRADDREGFLRAVKEAFLQEDEILVERFVEGREFSCGLLDGEALPLIEIRPKGGFYDYAHKYQPGWTEEITPAPLAEEPTKAMQRAAELAYRALGLSAYGRMDFILDRENRAYCLEANTLPGMTPTSLLPQEAAVLGIDYPTLCERIVASSLKKYQ